MKEAEARGAASQIKPEMPGGLQALITSAPIKRGLDANQRRQTGSVGRRWPSEFVRPSGRAYGGSSSSSGSSSACDSDESRKERKFQMDFLQLEPFRFSRLEASLDSPLLWTLHSLKS